MKVSEEKIKGRFYTPEFLAREILDFAGYEGEAILRKNLIDNSCGDGAFLREVVRRYCENFLRTGTDLRALKTELGTFVHGIEIDSKEAEKCRGNLGAVAAEFGLLGVRWDVRQKTR